MNRSRVWIAVGLVVCVLAGIGLFQFISREAPVSHEEFLAAVPKPELTTEQCEQAVEQLVNPDKPPVIGRHMEAEDFPPGFISGLRVKQKPIEAAYQKLSSSIESALPILVKHADDHRYSHIYVDPHSGFFHKADVSETCDYLIRDHVEVYRRHTSGLNESSIPKSIYFVGNIAAWWKGREGKTLAELQLEGIEWAIHQPKPKHFKSEDQWAKAVRSLKEMARIIMVTRRPIEVKSEFQFERYW